MEKEIFDGLIDVFNHDYDLFLSLQDITRRMKSKGFYKNIEFNKAMLDIQIRLTSPTFYRRRTATNDGWALARRWFHHKEKRENAQQDSTISSLQIGREIQRTISPNGSDIENGTIPLRGQDFDSFFASMDKEQQRRLNIDIHYYADESIPCNLIEDDHDNWFLKSTWLGEWYKENRIEPGDKIWLVIKSITPLAINIYTEWERNPDTYRRYRQLQDSKPLISTDLPIRDIIWDFLEQTQKITHRSDIAKTVVAKRPEVSEQSVYGCLSANPYLFVRVGEGKWGLKEWGLEQVTMAIRPAGSPVEENIDENLPTTTVPLDYILVNIASENLVYRILKNSKSLTVSEITEKISKILYVDKNILARTTFFDQSDIRLLRLQDGTFTLRENLEDVIKQLAEKERELKTSLEKQAYSLKDEMEVMTARHKKQVEQVEEERDVLRKLAEEWIEKHEEVATQWNKRTQLLSEFLTEAISHIGQNKLKEIFEHLRHKSEFPNQKRDT